MKRPVTILSLAFLLSLTALSTTVAQQDSADTLRNRFVRHSLNALHEKIYAHLDRTFYLTGETVWFKLYVVDGTLHRPLEVSKVAYAEVLDATGLSVLQAKIELTEGRGHGSFYLPASLNSGNYRIRIYTNWMKNFGPQYFFDQVITLVNPFVVPARPQPPQAPSCRIDFFPEGGQLVDGIESTVAFRISGNTTHAQPCRGFLLNGTNDTLATLQTGPTNIGHFLLTPAAGETYRAILTDVNGSTKVLSSFPTVERAGYAMQLRNGPSSLIVTASVKDVEDQHLLLFIHARQKIVLAEQKPIVSGQVEFSINKTDLPEGVSHLTLFNAALKPVCERLYFRWPDKKLDIEGTTNARVYTPRQKVSLTLRTGSAEKPLPANLSLSVYKDDSLSQQPPAHIFPYLWLASDLPERVDSLGFYLRQQDSGVGTPVDELMLTYGWRRFDWEDVLSGTDEFVHLPEVNGHIINGVVTREGKMQQSVFTYLGSPGKIIRAYGSWSNAEGQVRFEIKDFYGPRKIIIRTKTDTSATYDVAIANPFSPEAGPGTLPAFRPDVRLASALLERSIAMQVQDVYYYEAFGNRLETPVVDSSAFYGRADNTYLLDDYTRFPVMEEVMREYVPGVFVRKRRDGFHFLIIDAANGGLLSGDPMVLVDGIPVFDVDDIMKMDPLRVKKLEVIKQQYYLGQAAFPGIVSYSTYNGDLGDLVLDPRSVIMDYEGLQLKRRFYSPRYPEENNTRLPDQRYLLHWEPDIATDSEGNYRTEFYTSDVPGRYKVVVEGLTQEGLAGTKVFTFEVRPSENQ